MPKGAAFWGGHARNLALGAPKLGAFTVDWTIRRYLSYRRIPYVALPSKAACYPLDFNAEQLPNQHSRIYQAGSRDRFGTPFANVDWRMSDEDVQSIAANLRTLRRAFATSGIARVEFDDDLDAQIRAEATPIGGHHLGVARMSETAETGIVDRNLRAHALANLYVTGSATLPTSSHANPTLTILALTLRLADHLRATT